MNNRLVVNILRFLLILAVIVIATAQAVLLPWLSKEMARELPAEAYMRWPILTLAILGLLCVQVAAQGRLHLHLQHRQRCAQLVGGVAHKTFLVVQQVLPC